MTGSINWKKVNELRDDVGAEDFGEIVDLFLSEVDEVVDEVGNVGRSIEHDLHFLKGSAGNLGFATFADLCRTGEAMAAAGNGETVDVDAIRSSYQLSKEEFLAELDANLAN